jgi:hypothetical protein
VSEDSRRLIVDVDALVKLAHWGLLGELEGATGIPPERQATVESIQFRAARRDPKLFRDATVADYLAVALSRFGAAWRPDAEVVARLQGIAGLDAGEITLIAMLCSDPGAVLVTGDKRALRALAAPGLEDIVERVVGRIACLEQVVLSALDRLGVGTLATSIEPHRDLDIAIRCAVPLPPYAVELEVRKGLLSYIEDLRKDAPSLLYE